MWSADRNLLLGIVFAYFIVVVWDIFTQRYFTRYEGGLKRGVRIWAQPLTSETRQFLESLQQSVRNGKHFIRKQDHQVIISEERGWTGRDNWPYIAYVNLSNAEGLIEFRMPWSSLIFWTICFILVVALPLFGFFSAAISIAVLLVLIGWVLFVHHKERQRLLHILRRAILEQQGQRPENYFPPEQRAV